MNFLKTFGPVEKRLTEISDYRQFGGLKCSDYGLMELNGLMLQMTWTILKAVIDEIRIIPTLIYYLAMFWVFFINGFGKTIRNNNSRFTVFCQISVYSLHIVIFHKLLELFVYLFFTPSWELVLSTFQNIAIVNRILGVS